MLLDLHDHGQLIKLIFYLIAHFGPHVIPEVQTCVAYMSKSGWIFEIITIMADESCQFVKLAQLMLSTSSEGSGTLTLGHESKDPERVEDRPKVWGLGSIRE